MDDFPEYPVKLNRQKSPMPEYKRNTLRRKKPAVSSPNVRFRLSNRNPKSKGILSRISKGNKPLRERSFSSFRGVLGASSSFDESPSRQSRLGSARSGIGKGHFISGAGSNLFRRKASKYRMEDIQDVDLTFAESLQAPEFEPSDDIYRKSFLDSMRLHKEMINFDNFDDSEEEDNDTQERETREPRFEVSNFTTINKEGIETKPLEDSLFDEYLEKKKTNGGPPVVAADI